MINIKPGFLSRDLNGNIIDARSSVTLIISDSIIIVDTGYFGDDKAISKRLSEVHLNHEDIDIVVNTHNHIDHTANNSLFNESEILSFNSGLRDGEHIAKGVTVIETPGHTYDSISVVCDSDMKIIISGDALPTLNNYLKHTPPRIHSDLELAGRSMDRIIEAAELVIPGHDRPFLIRNQNAMACRAYRELVSDNEKKCIEEGP